jgi:hypothetical protein
MRRSSLLVALGVLALAGEGCGKARRASPAPMEGPMATPWVAPGIRQPPVKPASEVTLPDDTPVVGVVVAGKSRAYSLPAMSRPDRQIVNDLVGGVPVTVVYGAAANCLRVFTTEARGRPLEVSQMGQYRGGVLLKYQNRTYAQDTGSQLGDGPALPLTALEHERTTWKAWRDKHPDTEVYVGPDDLPEDAGKEP